MNPLHQVAQCNVMYHLPGQTDRSAMPLGNGELCASLWCQGDRELCFYLARSDALTELDRTVKLGRIRVTFSEPVFGPDFAQTLHVEEGYLSVEDEGLSLFAWVEQGSHTMRLWGRLPEGVEAQARYETWRTVPLGSGNSFDPDVAAVESADVVRESEEGTWFFHRNGETMVAETATLQEVTPEERNCLSDLLEGRIFGGLLTAAHNGDEFSMAVPTHSTQDSEEAFFETLAAMRRQLLTPEESFQDTRCWWRDYWRRSYVFVEGDPPAARAVDPALWSFCTEPAEFSCECPSMVTRAYTLTKYMTACCSRGALPILYNGMLFNLCPGGRAHLDIEHFGSGYTAQPSDDESEVNPDERSWATEELWQNLRHPYHSMLARGESESMPVLFRYFERLAPLNRLLAKKYYGAEGQHSTEMTLSFGLKSCGIYGKDRTGKPLGYADNRWGGAVDVSPGLERVALMQDYYDFTDDTAFFREQLWPFFQDLLTYIETRFPMRRGGKVVLTPLHAVETYWDTVNPIPTVAGLRSVLGRMEGYSVLDEAQRAFVTRWQRQCPELPRENGLLASAEASDGVRHNVEIPALYAIFPFRNFTWYKPEADMARQTFTTTVAEFGLDQVFPIGATPGCPSYSGWQYLGVAAALLGMTDKAAEILTHNCAQYNPGTRFPAMWGPIYDAVPDTDHGANILNQLQTMVMQVEGKTIYLLPAFPRNWNVSFRLWADRETVVEGTWRGGAWADLRVTPEHRRNDIILAGE